MYNTQMSYRNAVITGVSWQAVLKILSFGLVFIKIAITARILTANDFGLFSLILISLGLTESFTQTGINTTLLQTKRSLSYFLDTAWVIAIVRGFIIGLAMILIGWALSQWYDNPTLFFLTGFASLVPVLKGFINPAIISWQKNLQFGADSWYRLSLVAVEVVITLIASLLLQSVLALLIGILLAAIWEVALSWIFLQQKPTFSYKSTRASEIFQNGKWLSFSAALDYLQYNLDNLLLGKTLGTELLGVYDRGYALTHKSYDVVRSINHSTLPVFTKLQSEQNRIRTGNMRTLTPTIGLLLVGLLVVSLFPAQIIQVALGSKWLELTPVLSWLMIAAIVHSLASMLYMPLLATKKYWWLNAHLLVNVLTMIVAVWVGSNWFGLPGAVIGLTLSRVITLPIIIVGYWLEFYRGK